MFSSEMSLKKQVGGKAHIQIVGPYKSQLYQYLITKSKEKYTDDDQKDSPKAMGLEDVALLSLIGFALAKSPSGHKDFSVAGRSASQHPVISQQIDIVVITEGSEDKADTLFANTKQDMQVLGHHHKYFIVSLTNNEKSDELTNDTIVAWRQGNQPNESYQSITLAGLSVLVNQEAETIYQARNSKSSSLAAVPEMR